MNFSMVHGNGHRTVQARNKARLLLSTEKSKENFSCPKFQEENYEKKSYDT